MSPWVDGEGLGELAGLGGAEASASGLQVMVGSSWYLVCRVSKLSVMELTPSDLYALA